jgi:hypothetical protein
MFIHIILCVFIKYLINVVNYEYMPLYRGRNFLHVMECNIINHIHIKTLYLYTMVTTLNKILNIMHIQVNMH